jgi:hypothetical protein
MTAKRKDPAMGVPRAKELNVGLRSAQSLPALTNNLDEHSEISATRIKWRAAAPGAD